MLTEQSQQEGGIYRKQDSEFEATSWKREEGSSGSSHRNPVEKAEKVYVGHLPFDITKRELEELFGRCGPLTSVEIKHGGFAFLQFREANDAMHAVETLNDLMFEGKRLSVQFSLKKGAGNASSNCLICNKEGHWARECPESKEKGLDVKSGKCFKCGKGGHLARFCRGDSEDQEVAGPRKSYRPQPPVYDSYRGRPRQYHDQGDYHRPRSISPKRHRAHYDEYESERRTDRYDRGYPPSHRYPESAGYADRYESGYAAPEEYDSRYRRGDYRGAHSQHSSDDYHGERRSYRQGADRYNPDGYNSRSTVERGMDRGYENDYRR